MNNENGITQSKTKTTSTGKRKTFSNKKKKKKKRKQPQKQQQQKEEEVRGVKRENFNRYDKEDSERRSNYETVSNVSMTTSSLKTSGKDCKLSIFFFHYSFN